MTAAADDDGRPQPVTAAMNFPPRRAFPRPSTTRRPPLGHRKVVLRLPRGHRIGSPTLLLTAVRPRAPFTRTPHLQRAPTLSSWYIPVLYRHYSLNLLSHMLTKAAENYFVLKIYYFPKKCRFIVRILCLIVGILRYDKINILS